MLQPLIAQFLVYCQLANFSARCIQAMEIRPRELRYFVRDRKLPEVADIGYLQLVVKGVPQFLIRVQYHHRRIVYFID